MSISSPPLSGPATAPGRPAPALTTSAPVAAAAAGSRWLRIRRSPGPARRRLLCLPPAGGTAQAYGHWAEQLPDGTEVVSVELPGHGSRMGEPALHRMADVIDGIETALAALPELPLVIFGHSMGAVVGWELARSLRHRYGQRGNDGGDSGDGGNAIGGGSGGQPVRGIIVAASAHPAADRPDRWAAGADTPDEELLALLDHSRSLPPALREHPEFLRVYLPVLRADLEVLARHRARRERPMPCALRVYTGGDDPLVGPDEAWPWGPGEVDGDRLLRVFPGGHFFLHENPGPVLAALARDLELITPGA
ncbi:thioesterase II family protein [Streptomyces sp. NPDC090036]|uniref:thioesterase II family protein n=1 Tax=Streptomyces sp. NPDC090036 TaxID=3365926 RepID=UPI0038308C0D